VVCAPSSSGHLSEASTLMCPFPLPMSFSVSSTSSHGSSPDLGLLIPEPPRHFWTPPLMHVALKLFRWARLFGRSKDGDSDANPLCAVCLRLGERAWVRGGLCEAARMEHWNTRQFLLSQPNECAAALSRREGQRDQAPTCSALCSSAGYFEK
jgi:hypothetical protein